MNENMFLFSACYIAQEFHMDVREVARLPIPIFNVLASYLKMKNEKMEEALKKSGGAR